MKDLEPELRRRKSAHLYRQRRILDSPQQAEIQLDGKKLLSFSSNDYLGLANHPQIISAFQQGAEQYGVGAGAAHLVNGHSRAHHQLEEELADFLQRPRALLFSTGYMANLGIISALLGRNDHLFEDRLNHASLIDGALLSRAKLHRYAHNDMQALSQQLETHAKGERLVAVDGVFSMDGDSPPLPELAAICQSSGAWLLVDDAHGFGVLGKQGRGSLEHHGLNMQDVPVLMATLGKGLGVFGAFVAGSEALIETLIQQARSYIFTTALPPAVAEATRAALKLVVQEGWRRQHLQHLIQRFRKGVKSLGLPLMNSQTAIQPLLAGSSEQALAWSRHLEQAGILVTPIRPPTVPEGSARLRITLSAAHTEKHLDRLLDALAELPMRQIT